MIVSKGNDDIKTQIRLRILCGPNEKSMTNEVRLERKINLTLYIV